MLSGVAVIMVHSCVKYIVCGIYMKVTVTITFNHKKILFAHTCYSMLSKRAFNYLALNM